MIYKFQPVWNEVDHIWNKADVDVDWCLRLKEKFGNCCCTMYVIASLQSFFEFSFEVLLLESEADKHWQIMNLDHKKTRTNHCTELNTSLTLSTATELKFRPNSAHVFFNAKRKFILFHNTMSKHNWSKARGSSLKARLVDTTLSDFSISKRPLKLKAAFTERDWWCVRLQKGES